MMEGPSFHRHLYSMRYFLLGALVCAPLFCGAQSPEVNYPYNPDYDATGDIGINDLLPVLTLFTQQFQAEGIMVDTLSLEEAFLMMMGQIAALQQQVETLQAQVIPGLSDHLSVVDDETLLVTGANLQVVNGNGITSSANGVGNVIIGYNEADSATNERGGSHNLVLGRYNQYSSFSGIVHGLRNSVLNDESAVIAGSNNLVSGVRSAVMGGDQNTASGNKVVAIGGGNNEAKGSIAIALGGQENTVDLVGSVAIGGRSNQALGGYSVLVGGGDNITRGYKSVLMGGEHNETLDQDGVNDQFSAVFGGRFNKCGDYCGSIAGGNSNSLLTGLNGVPGYSSQSKTIVGGTSNVNEASSYATILGGSGLHLAPRDTANYFGGQVGFYGPTGDVGIGTAPGTFGSETPRVYLGSSANPQFILTGDAPEE